MSSFKYLKQIKGTSAPVRMDAEPSFGYIRDAKYAGDSPDVFLDGLWYLTTNVEEVTNGTFDTNTVNWVEGGGSQTTISDSGVLALTQNTTTNSYVSQTITVEVGIKYTFSGDLMSLGSISLGTAISDATYGYVANVGGTYTVEFIPTSATLVITLTNGTNGYTSRFDNISVFETKPTLGTIYATEQTYYRHKFEVIDGEVVDIHDWDYPSTIVDMLHTKKNVKIVDFGTVFTLTRYVYDNPFGNENYEGCIVRAELFHNGIWSEAPNSWNNVWGSVGTVGYSNSEGIVIQTGSKVRDVTSNTIDGFGGGPLLTSAPCRAIVTYIGEATDA
jgi:hypothetical protein